MLRIDASDVEFDGRIRGLVLASNLLNEPVAMSKISKVNETATAAVSDGWVSGGSLFTSILAGTLMGLGLDAWLGTGPWLVVIGIVLGSISGFYRMWDYMGTPLGKQDIFDDR